MKFELDENNSSPFKLNLTNSSLINSRNHNDSIEYQSNDRKLNTQRSFRRLPKDQLRMSADKTKTGSRNQNRGDLEDTNY